MRKYLFILIAAISLLTSACGFEPLYAKHENGASVTAALASVQVMSIHDEGGQELRNNILDKMPPTAPQPRYQLRVLTAESAFGIAIARDATVTRQELRNNVHAELYDTQTQTILWRLDTAATAGYNIVNSQYQNLVGADDARHRNYAELAERVVNQLSLFFDRPQ